MTKPKRYKRYSAEFKREALRRAAEEAQWGGTTHQVQITGGGCAIWNGQSYPSLSAVARAMTGTNRNGPKFFGFRPGSTQ